jgi:hypothetical protein
MKSKFFQTIVFSRSIAQGECRDSGSDRPFYPATPCRIRMSPLFRARAAFALKKEKCETQRRQDAEEIFLVSG